MSTVSKKSGLTLVEVLVIAPIVILLIGIFIGVIVSITGDVISTRSSNSQSFSIQDALNRIEQDVKYSTEFLATNNITLTSPQGINDTTGLFHNSDATYGSMLILNMYGTTKNPADSSKSILYMNEPNSCASGKSDQNSPLMFNVVYFVKNNNLYRRVIARSDYASNCNPSTKAAGTSWQQPTCTAGYVAAFCKTQDELLVTNISSTDGFLTKYYPSASSSIITSATDSSKSDPDRQSSLNTANSVNITINTSIVAAGRESSQTGSIKAVKYSNVNLPAAFKNPDSFLRTWGGSTKTDYAYGLAQGLDGSFVTTGYYGSGTFGGVANNAIAVKYKPNGSMMWTRQWGGSSDVDIFYAVNKTNDGGYIATGRTNNFPSGNGGGDMIIVKYNSDGSIGWQKTWGSTVSTESAMEAIQTSDGGYAVVGFTASIESGKYDVVLLKYTSTGTLSWSRAWGTASGADDLCYSIVQTSDNGYVMTGRTNTGVSTRQGLLIKFDVNGNLVWNKTWGSTGSDNYLRKLILTSDGGFATIGYSNSFNGATSNDAVLIKYNSSGIATWSTYWGSSSANDQAWSLIQTTDGGYVISGQTLSYGNMGGYSDAFVAKFNDTGTLSWSKTFGSTGDDFGWEIIKTLDGGFAVTGKTDFGIGAGDMFLAKYKSDGTITNCSSPMCQSITASSASITGTQTTPSVTITSNPSGFVDSIPTPLYSNPQGSTFYLAQP